MEREPLGASPESRAQAGAMPVVEMSGVSRAFRMGEVEVHALEDVNLTLGRGELIVVLGPSGSGKTTLLNLLGGLDRPTSGVIRYGTTDITTLSDGELGRFRRNHVGFVFQFFNLIPTLTARENVEFAAELVSSDRQVIDARVGELLSMVGLQERTDHFPSQLSGGEQQRVAIARALAKDPDLVLCDEPTGNLDFRAGRQILEFLQALTAERGKTVVLVTHNSAIASIGDRVIRLRDGRVQSDQANRSPFPASQIEW
jgi:putative ABC transport system ATP-binding protein